MWDYNKLFTEGNIVGLLYPDGEIVPFPCKFREESNVESLVKYYGNKDLKCEDYKIQYIIRLDEHGNVIEKLFDRKRDMPKPMPELEDGMFILVNSYNNEKVLGYVDVKLDKIIFQDGSWSRPNYIYNKKPNKILEIYPSYLNCFGRCISEKAIWRSPDYQAYLDSKST